MTDREKLIQYVKHGGDKVLCSPQIGAGAGFDTRLAGKTWISETTFEDTRKACSLFDITPLFNFPLPDLTLLTDNSKYESVKTVDGTKRHTHTRFKTPKGDLISHTVEQERNGSVMTKYLITDEEELSVLEYYLDTLLEVKDFTPITEKTAEIRKAVGDGSALDIQWSMQPYELMCFPDTMNTAIFAKTCPDVFKRLMDKILRLNEFLIPAVARGGVDFVFLGGPGSEMISPQYYEEFIVPYSSVLSQIAHDNGMLIYSHICSPIEPMLTMGYYNRMGIDLFETLSEAPVGNIKSIGDAFGKLDPDICTRGNVGLDKLLLARPEEILEISLSILEKAKNMGRKHILAASDYLFYDIKEENVRAMVKAVKMANSGKGLLP